MGSEAIAIPSEEMGWINKFVGPMLKIIKDRQAEVAVEMRTGFYGYALRTRDRCGYLKTIVSRGELVHIDTFYVAPQIRLGRSSLSLDQLVKRVSSRKRLVVTGAAGLGKSVFLKKIVMQYSSSMAHPLPVFLELRDLNDSKSTIKEAIFGYLNAPRALMSAEQYEYALSEGMIALFLDAFDELNSDLREGYEKEIINLSVKYPDLQMIVTSRPSPNDEVETWGPFESACLEPFDLDRVVQLVRALSEPEDDKEKFIELLKSNLFKSHQSFLSTPLLALIMFLTFQAGGQIPDKLHEFYHRAFEALYYRHDMAKGHYVRKPYTNLSRDEFRRAISAVCAITYFEGVTSLPEVDFCKRVDQALSIEGIQVETKLLLSDLIEGICMLQRDGIEIGFTHRSFQEYFTAMFILNSEVLDTFGVINQLIAKQTFDNVVSMIGEMNREFLERKWVTRWLALYADKMKGIDPSKNLVPYLKALRYSSVVYYDGEAYRLALLALNDNGGAINTVIYNLYPNEFLQFAQGRFAHPKHADREMQDLAAYFMARDGIKKPRKKSDRNAAYSLSLSDRDADKFVGTITAANFDVQRLFLLDLKEKIEKRHKEKGEGFMSLIRRPAST